MAYVSHKLKTSFQGALAGGGDPATSPLYVFGPFLKLIVVAGVAPVTFGASVWMVVLTVAMVSTMYRLVMIWVVDGSGGSGLSEEEFGSWAVKVNAAITFIEYTLTFLVSIAALVTFIADRFPVLNQGILGFQYRTFVAIALSVLTGWMVNRGPQVAARAFGPATLGVLILLWTLIIATIWKLGFHLPEIDLRAFSPAYLDFTLGGYARILALITGIEIFANLVAAYEGISAQKSQKAFRSLLIIMGTTSVTMLVVGPAIFQLSDPTNEHVSVFTQTMDGLLPAPLPYLGTLVGIMVLLSASAASAQGLQNLALGLRYRHYIPAPLGQRNFFDVADKPVWIEVGLVSLCYLAFGTNEKTYLAIYAAGVFILLSMTGWAVAKRLIREMRSQFSVRVLVTFTGTCVASLLTSGATIIIFVERFFEGAWSYFLLIPILYGLFSYFRSRLGEPTPLEDSLGRVLAGQYLLPYQRAARPEDETRFDRLLIPLDGSSFAEQALPAAEVLGRAFGSRLTLISVIDEPGTAGFPRPDHGPEEPGLKADREAYLGQVSSRLKSGAVSVNWMVTSGSAAERIATMGRDLDANLIVMSTHGRSGVERLFLGEVAGKVVRSAGTPLLLLRPTEEWRTRQSQFRKLLVSLDGSDSSEHVLRFARALAKRFDSEILLLAVPEAESEIDRVKYYLDQVAAALRVRGLKAEALVTGSGPARIIVALSESEGVDLVMMTTHGRGGPQRPVPLGSVTSRVIQSTLCPVFIVPVQRWRR